MRGATMAFAGKPRRVLFIVENLPSPFDRRVWQEATTLRDSGYEVSIICPTGKGFEKRFEIVEGIHIYRHNLPLEAEGAIGYLIEYSAALFWEFTLAFKVLFTRGFDAIHACNPPDLIFLVGGFFKLFFGKKFLFDHHDINPELFLRWGYYSVMPKYGNIKQSRPRLWVTVKSTNQCRCVVLASLSHTQVFS